jgi:Na+/H+-translocating membrane pyrophosphatase
MTVLFWEITALKMVEEVRRQFNTIPGLMKDLKINGCTRRRNTSTSRTLDLVKEVIFSLLLHVVDVETYSYDDQVIMKAETK